MALGKTDGVMELGGPCTVIASVQATSTGFWSVLALFDRENEKGSAWSCYTHPWPGRSFPKFVVAC